MSDDRRACGEGEGERCRRKVIPFQGWKIRFDAPPSPELSRHAEQGDILALFQACYDTRWRGSKHAPDRRHDPRYAPAETQIWVGWWKGVRFLATQAALVNLSKGGTLVQMRHQPPQAQPVWICLGTPHPLDCVQARVLDTSPCPDVGFNARMEFHSPCPSSFFRAAGHRSGPPAADNPITG
jgi:hypothetical protein